MQKIELLNSIKSEIPVGTKVIAVSKTKPVEDILEFYNNGHKIFGENKVQELAQKYEVLPKDTEWHYIGHLQTNKVKYIAPFVHLIHAVDSLKLLKVINKEALKNERVIPCLIQLKIAQEETKFGLSQNGIEELLQSEDFKLLKNIQINGVMGMATNTSDINQVTGEFREIKEVFLQLRDKYFADKDYFSEISTGMSHDYLLAVNEGSTMVRIGSKLFGERIYKK